MNSTVYAIIDPRSQRPFYVGQTRAFRRRCQQHLDGTDQISGLIVRQIQETGFVPHFVVLETHQDEETALRAEIFWIETLLARGIDLTNSQAFSGYWERTSKRGAETRKLAEMQKLRALANGRTAKRTRPRSGQDGAAKSPARTQPNTSGKPPTRNLRPRRRRRIPSDASSDVRAAGRP